ncbi:hypothetical protein GHT06_014617 [Daphnia sinensis]|uniref:Uncharacterized protein n=1 Tax=Daphnia sinensis TaxID=1820382 RepID=A0AAD5PS59_9CRUS|nr:hypothetical protein GHT06_014617 [Daphnia sinensis]
MAVSWDKLSSMVDSVNTRSPNALEQLLEEVNFQRRKERRKCVRDDSDFVMLHGTPYWTDLFVRHFLFESDQSIDADDLLFFVRKKLIKGSTRFLMKFETEVEVFRRDSKKLPIGDPDVAWEETLYLNLIIHQFDYMLTLAVCTRTSPKDLQVLKRHCQRVYASPSRRRMDVKGDLEEITYPNICFMVDNFDEVYDDMLVRDGEMVCVELVATNRRGIPQGVLFLGSIRYEALKKVYDSRASLGTRVAQKFSLGLWNGSSTHRMEFVRMKGPQGKGHSEMAVTKPKSSGLDTPCSEPGFSATELWDAEWDSEPEDLCSNTRQRRLSEPSGGMPINSRCQRPNTSHQMNGSSNVSRSENENLDKCSSTWNEIEAGDVRDGMLAEESEPTGVPSHKTGATYKQLVDGNRVYFRDGESARPNVPAGPPTELDDGVCNPLWTMKGFTQTFHYLKESRRAQSVPLNALLTYVTVPWYSIIADILDHHDTPTLTF